MGEAARIQEQLRRASEGGAWHGPALLELLKDVGPGEAAARPLPEAHTIGELVRHVAAWETIVSRRVEGEPVADVPDAEDWPPYEGGTGAWEEAREEARRSNRRLREAVGRLSDERLSDTVPGASYSVYEMVHGAVQHTLYHAGQVALLRKAAASREPNAATTSP